MAQTNSNSSGNQVQGSEKMLSEDLVRQVAQRVYELWQQDARIEAERRRLARSRWKHR
jgi:hypothetical protein